jgi:hypothetical protein
VWGPNTYQPVKDEHPGGEMRLEAEFSVTYELGVLGKLVWMCVDEMLCWRWPKMGRLVEGARVRGFVTMEGDHRRRNRGRNVV